MKVRMMKQSVVQRPPQKVEKSKPESKLDKINLIFNKNFPNQGKENKEPDMEINSSAKSAKFSDIDGNVTQTEQRSFLQILNSAHKSFVDMKQSFNDMNINHHN